MSYESYHRKAIAEIFLLELESGAVNDRRLGHSFRFSLQPSVSHITQAVIDRRVNHRGLIQSVIFPWLVCESAWIGEACIFEIRLSE